MNCYPENTQISIEVEATDASGATHETTCQMKFVLYDIDGKELFSESREVTKKDTIVIAAEYNKITNGSTKDLRRLDIRFYDPKDESLISAQEIMYFIRSEKPLVVGENSFVTYESYVLIASMTPHLDNFASASQDAIVVALQEAHDRLMRLRFRLSMSTRQENVGYVSEVAWRPRSITDDEPLGIASFRFTLDEVTPEEFAKLPEKFRKALAKAQVIEADQVLASTDSIEERRRRGVILETVHEVKQMFSSVRPANEKLTRNAMLVLAPYLDTTNRVRRV